MVCSLDLMRNPVFFMRGGYSILVLIGVALLMSACGLSEIRKQTAQAENVGVINGRVEVTSEVGRGSTFCLIIPQRPLSED